MSEVALSVVKVTVEALEKMGADPIPALRGLRLERSDLSHPLRRVPWNEFVDFVEHAARLAESHGGLARFGALQHSTSGLAELKAFAATLVSPARLLRYMFAMGGWAYPHLHSQHDELPDGAVRLTLELPAPYRECRRFFELVGASIGYGTTHLGLPPARVEADVHPRGGQYRVISAPVPTLAERIRAARNATEAIAVERLEQLYAELTAALRRSSPPSPSAWRLTERQRQVLELLVQGRPNKEVAAILGCAERTVEVHVTEILRRSGCTSRAQLIATYWASRGRDP